MAVAALAASLFALLPTALAQQQLRQPRASVEIDWSVLDELGPALPSRPRLTPPAPRTAQPAVTPPRRVPDRAAAPKAKAASPPKKAPAVKLTPPTAKPSSAAKPSTPAFAPPAPPPTFADKPPPARTPPVAASAPPRALPPPAATPPAQAVTAAPLPPPAAAATAPAPVVQPPPAPVVEAPKPPPAVEPAKPQIATPAPTPAIPAAPPAPAKPTDPPPQAVPAGPGQQLAALSPAALGTDGRLARIDFATGGTDLPDSARAALDRAIAEMKRDENARLQLIAYASGGDEAGSQARRLSLSRALAVRSYLIDQGVRSTRVDVRALGSKVPEGPPDRVDVLLVRR